MIKWIKAGAIMELDVVPKDIGNILFNIFNIAIINSFILFKQNNPSNCRFSLLSYKVQLVLEMMDKYRKESIIDHSTSLSITPHCLVSCKLLVCVECKNMHFNTIRTSFQCNVCEISLCTPAF